MGYSIPLRKREVVARETMAFYFQKPKGFSFRAGQYLDMTIPQKLDASNPENIRSFSLASAPFEQHLMVATRMRKSAFKQALRSLPIGENVTIQGPLGEFTLPNDTTRPLVFLAGGIGITPFFSIIRQALKDNLPHELSFFYSNHGPEDTAFLSEFEELRKTHPRFRFIATMTNLDMSKTPWQGHTGYIDEAMIKQYVADLAAPLYYLAGPLAMVGAMAQLLHRLGIDNDKVRIEEFSGY